MSVQHRRKARSPSPERAFKISGIRNVDLERLTAAQRAADQLPHAMAGYLGFVARRMDVLRVELPERFQTLRVEAKDLAEVHARIPSTIAHITLGLEMFLDYAAEVGAAEGRQIAALRQRLWRALMSQGSSAEQMVAEVRPAQEYMETLAALFSEHKAQVLDKKLAEAESPDPPHIGWLDGEYVYLKPKPAFKVAREAAWKTGAPLSQSEPEMRRELAREGLLLSDQDHLTRNVRFGGKQRRVLQVKREAVREMLGHDLFD